MPLSLGCCLVKSSSSSQKPALVGQTLMLGSNSDTIISFLLQAARSNVLLAVPALLYAINNYLKFTMQVPFL